MSALDRRLRRSVGALLLPMVLAQGCVAIPRHDAAPLPDPKSYRLDRDIDAALAGPGFQRGDWPQPEWWKLFRDPQLDRLMELALAGNPDLRIAEARVRLALQQAAAVHAGNFPQVQADGSVTRERFSRNYIFPPEIASQPQNEGQLAISAGFDLDVWNRNRALYAARLDAAQAALADQAETRLLIGITLAGTYFHWQALQVRYAVTEDALAQRRDLARLFDLRAHAGLESKVAVRQADADVERTRASLEAIAREREAAARALAALAGRGPNDMEPLQPATPRAAEPLALPAVVPMDLLARRPDVVATLWQVEAAAREVGAAKAGFYPNIDLGAAAGYQSLDLRNLIRPDSIFTSFGPAIHLPIFGGGRLKAQLGAAYAGYDIAVEQYHRALVNAAREVADELAAVRALNAQQAHQAQALKDSEEADRLARLRYRNGLTDFLNVLLVQRDLLQQRDLNAQLDDARQQAILGLIKSIGGGYQAQSMPAAAMSLRR